MSSTNRSNARDAHISDYYVTPVTDIKKYLSLQTDFILNDNTIILDPCAGGDADKFSSYPVALIEHIYKDNYNNIIKQGTVYSNLNGRLRTIDIREDSAAEFKEDYLQFDVNKLIIKPNLIITNPPFTLALPIIMKSLQIVEEGGFVVMLLRLNFLGSQERFPFWQSFMPISTYIHSKRLKFTAKGTDSIEYMHCVWQKGNYPETTKLKVI